MLKETFFEVKKNRIIKQILFLFVGITLYSVYAGLLLPGNKLSAGGALGIAMMLNKYIGIKVGTAQFILNIPLVYIAYKYIGKKFLILTGIVVGVSSLIINALVPYVSAAFLDDKLVASVFAGILSGVAIACILMGGASTGGSDVTGKYFAKKFEWNLPAVFLMQDIIIYILLWISFDIRTIMYALILSFVRNQTLKFIERFLSAYIQCTIIVENADELVDVINTTLHRGSTIVEAEGGYTHKKQRMIILIIQQNELHMLRKLIKKHAPSAFITVNSVNTIVGNFKEHSYRL